mgnify:CR=1 FL=1
MSALLRDSLQVLSSQKASGQRRPAHGSIAVLLKESSEIAFHLFPDKHVVLILSRNWFMEVVLLADGKGFKNYGRMPVTGAPVKSLTVLYYFMKAPAYLLKRGITIEPMTKDNINVVHLQSFE